MIHVLARITTAPGMRDAFLEEFHRLMPLVHAEEGCLEYGPAVDAVTSLPTQERLGASTVMVIEKWADLPSLQRHLVAPHMVEYRERVKDLVENVSLQVLDPA